MGFRGVTGLDRRPEGALDVVDEVAAAELAGQAAGPRPVTPIAGSLVAGGPGQPLRRLSSGA